MLKQTVSYFDFDDNESQETLYFNLTKAELADNLHLKDELESLMDIFKGEKREMTTGEVQRVLDLVKTLMRLSYGIRSSDGKRFIKSDEQWLEFTQSAVYDAFLYSMFEDGGKAIEFMTGILPKDLRAEAKKVMESENRQALSADKSEKTDSDDTMPKLTPEQMEAAAKAWAEREGK